MSDQPADATQSAKTPWKQDGANTTENSPAPTFRPLPVVGRFAIPIAGANADEIEIKTPGTTLARGELLVERWPNVCAAPLAPGDGRVVALGAVKLHAGLTVPAVLFEPKQRQPSIPPPPLGIIDMLPNMLRWVRDMQLAEGVEHLRRLGVWTDRWTSPNLLAQLNECLEKKIDTIICNVLDETPELLLHHELAMAYPVELVAGTAALAQLTGVKDVWAVLAAFGNSIAWDLLREVVADTKVKLVPLQDHYPQAHPTLLIHEINGRHVKPGQSSVEEGVLVLDAAAAIAVGRAFLWNAPTLSVPVGLRERLTNRTHWLDVPAGMPWSTVLSQLQLYDGRSELRAGNPLRELHLEGECVAGGSELSITFMPPRRVLNPDPCIRCAWCVEGCPVRIQPAGLLEAAQQNDPYLADKYGIEACVECGICSYVCPSHLPLLSAIRKMK